MSHDAVPLKSEPPSLIQRLREPYRWGGIPGRGSWEDDLMAEAADEIERLRKELDRRDSEDIYDDALRPNQ